MSSLLVGNGINNISNNINWKELLIDLMRNSQLISYQSNHFLLYKKDN